MIDSITAKNSPLVPIGPKSLPRRGNRSVSFAQTGHEKEAVTSVHTIISRYEMTQQEFQSAWYSNYEFHVMKLATVKILRRWVSGDLTLDEVDEGLLRGLENKTPKGSKYFKENRRIALWAVLDEQNRQQSYFERPNQNTIAEIYRQSNKHCRVKAYQKGLQDAEAAHGPRKKETTLSGMVCDRDRSTTTGRRKRILGKRRLSSAKLLKMHRSMRSLLQSNSGLILTAMAS